MVPKVKKPDPPKPIVSAADVKTFSPDDTTSRTYSSLISTSPSGLTTKARTQKKSLLGGTA